MDDPKDVKPADGKGSCNVCQKPLDDKDFGDHCRYCGDANGVKSYDDLIKGMTGYFKSQGMNDEEAAAKAKETVDGCDAMKQGKIKKGV